MNGELVEGDLFARPLGHVAAAPGHPNQEERFGVLQAASSSGWTTRRPHSDDQHAQGGARLRVVFCQ
jgi:hypothetical protein